jgi:hypothetical protein
VQVHIGNAGTGSLGCRDKGSDAVMVDDADQIARLRILIFSHKSVTIEQLIEEIR